MLTRSISVDIFSAIFVEGIQVVSATTQLKFLAPDGKKRLMAEVPMYVKM